MRGEAMIESDFSFLDNWESIGGGGSDIHPRLVGQVMLGTARGWITWYAGRHRLFTETGEDGRMATLAVKEPRTEAVLILNIGGDVHCGEGPHVAALYELAKGMALEPDSLALVPEDAQ